MSSDNQIKNETNNSDIAFLKHVQNGLPLTKTPYKDIAEELMMTEEDVINNMKRLLDEGKIRRLAASNCSQKR